jgi:pilus assembly protein CpaB
VNSRRVQIIAAAALGVFAVVAFVILGFANRPSQQIPTRAIVVAVRPIGPHTKLSEAMFAVAERPANDVDPAAISSLQGLDGMISAREIVANVPVTSADVEPEASLGLAVGLRQGMRAIAIPVDSVKDVSDLLHPGDRVDVIASPPRAGNVVTAFTIMRDITVLSMGPTFIETPAPAASSAPGAAQQPVAPVQARTVTLEVTPAQADLLTMADLNSTIRLALRPPNEPANSGLIEHLVFATPAPVSAPVVAGPPVRQAPPAPVGVPVINGDQVAGAGH